MTGSRKLGNSASSGRRKRKWWKCASGPGRGLTDPLTLTQHERPDSRELAHLWQPGERKANEGSEDECASEPGRGAPTARWR